MADRWIVIPGWDKFQHRDAGRSSRGFAWLRDYSDQLNKELWLLLGLGPSMLWIARREPA